MLFSNTQLVATGEQAFTAMKTEYKVSQTQDVNRYVTCVAESVIRQLDNRYSATEWEIVVFDDEQANAFALPGGKIGVYTGMLGVARNQHQVAAVIAHEVGHVIAAHGNERMSQSALIGLGQQAVAQILTANEVASTPTIMAALGVGVQLGVTLPYSRTHETEADLIGLDLMAKAGFDPRQSVVLWQNMKAANSGQIPPEFMSTHPAPDARIRMLSDNMPPALNHYNSVVNKPNCR